MGPERSDINPFMRQFERKRADCLADPRHRIDPIGDLSSWLIVDLQQGLCDLCPDLAVGAVVARGKPDGVASIRASSRFAGAFSTEVCSAQEKIATQIMNTKKLGDLEKIAVARSRGRLWREQHRIETGTKRNQPRANSGHLTRCGNFSKSLL